MRSLLLNLLLFLAFVNFNNLQAGVSSDTSYLKVLADTISKANYKKLSRIDFLEKYGTDDTSRALINYYFKKKKASIALIGVTSAIIILEGVIIADYSLDKDTENLSHSAEKVMLDAYSLFLFIPSLIVAPVGIIDAKIYSKKNLYKQLLNYHTGKGISSARRKRLIKYMKSQELKLK